jgi:outer membrane biosynthesis protein TonB
MDDDRRLEAKGLARAKIRSRRRRVSTIRRRTIRGSLALFAVLWAILFAQLASGNDPALSRIHGSHGQVAATQGAGTAAAPPRGAAASTAPPPEPEAESEQELEFEREPEFEAEPEFEPEAEPGFEPQPEPEPAAPLVTTAS